MDRISISEVQRNLHRLDDFDFVEIIDKKRNKIKGYFIEQKYASFVEEIAQKVEALKKDTGQKAAGTLRRYADKKKMAGEKSYWRKQAVEKYRQNDDR